MISTNDQIISLGPGLHACHTCKQNPANWSHINVINAKHNNYSRLSRLICLPSSAVFRERSIVAKMMLIIIISRIASTIKTARAIIQVLLENDPPDCFNFLHALSPEAREIH